MKSKNEIFEKAIDLHRKGKVADAIELYTKVIELDHSNEAAHYNRGTLYEKNKEYIAALQDYEKVLKISPRHENAWFNQANILLIYGLNKEALISYDHAVALNPNNPKVHANRSSAQKANGDLHEALVSIKIAIQLDPENPQYLNNQGLILRKLGRELESFACYEKATSLQPDYAEAHNNRGIASKSLGRTTEARHYFELALKYRPKLAEAEWNLSLLLLADGEWEKGWALHEARWRMETFSSPILKLRNEEWRGNKPIRNKTIYLHYEQGLGDTIQFCRYAPLLKELGAKVILGVQRTLIDLISTLEGIDEVIDGNVGASQYDTHVPLMSLPRIFSTTPETVPFKKAYLRSERKKRLHWQEALGPAKRPRVGLAWSGNPSHKNDTNRSMPLSTLLPYLPAHCDYFILQKDIRENDRACLNTLDNLHDFTTQITDFSDTAALCDAMDVVVSVDTSIAHLAGAMGKSVWIMLSTPPEWRWMTKGWDCVWYDSARLYRQINRRDWSNVLENIQRDLKQLKQPINSAIKPEN